LLALSTKLTRALPAAAPPMRKNTSATTSGLSGALPVGPAVPSERRLGEVTGPASMMSPVIFTPLFGVATRAGSPAWGTSVAKPRPSTIVFGLLTLIGPLRS